MKKIMRRIINIDAEKCNGCGICVTACHEGAIGLRDGKAVLLRDDYCDGLGDCLPACPVGAISFEEREALPFNEEEVKRNMALQREGQEDLPRGCPGTNLKSFSAQGGCPGSRPELIDAAVSEGGAAVNAPSRLSQWPVQLKLLPSRAAFFEGADLLIAADCAAYAYGNFHEDFIKGRRLVIGCPKLDMADYSQKLAEILSLNDIKSVTVARMEVPCCGGLEHAAKAALAASGKDIPLEIVTIGTEGGLLGRE